MKYLLSLLLLLPGLPRAQQLYENQTYNFALRYPSTGWQVVARPPAGTAVQLLGSSPATSARATITVLVLPVPANEKSWDLDRQFTEFGQAQQQGLVNYTRLAKARFSRPPYEGTLFTYTFDLLPVQHQVRLTVRRGGQYYIVLYTTERGANEQFEQQGLAIVQSLEFRPPAHPPYTYAGPLACDGKWYGVPLRPLGQEQSDSKDLQSLHELGPDAAAPVVHPGAFPFPTIAIAKGLDNNIYGVAYTHSDEAQFVYCYQPATRQGDFTPWQLPPIGRDNSWISGGTDRRGDLYFMSSDGGQFVRISPRTGDLTPVWTRAPRLDLPFDDGFGSRISNFGFDQDDVLYLVHSLNGTVYRYDLARNKSLEPLRFGLPGASGVLSYADVLVQSSAAGEPLLYLTGAGRLFRIGLRTRAVTLLSERQYSDLAGCYTAPLAARPSAPPSSPAPPAPPLPAATAPALATWQGRILDDSTRRPLPAARLLPADAPPVAVAATGAFAWPAAPGTAHAYRVQLPGYLAIADTWQATAADRRQDILLKKLRVGTTFDLADLRFERGKADMLPGSETTLRQLLRLLQEQPALRIRLEGHTDNTGDNVDPKPNQKLSEDRVAEVKKYLTSRGVTESRISTIGFGGSRPKFSNDREETRQLNRRVQCVVVGL